jgi:hypothetical protein
VTKGATLGGRSVEILRDTGVLLASLSPGTLDASGKNYSKPTATGKSKRAKAIREGGAQQIFEPGAGEIIVGTNVKYAATHQHGDRKRNIPARPFLPDENNPVPAIWFDRWAVLANKALVVGAELMYRRGV